MTDPSATVNDVVAAGLAEARQSITPTDGWGLRPGTVIVPGDTTVIVKFDGEGFEGTVSVSIPMISLIGYVERNARVMVLTIPPSGNYIIAGSRTGDNAQSSIDDVIFNSSSVTYTIAGAAALVGIVFTVPVSGKVLFHYGGYMIVGTAGHAAFITIQIQEGETIGSGSMILTASDDNATIMANTAGNPDRQGVSYLFKDGEPGVTYNATIMHRTTGALGTFDSRYLIMQLI